MKFLSTQGRRALPGKAARRNELEKQLWHVNSDITHYIIGINCAPNSVAQAKVDELKNEQSKIFTELMSITKEAK